MAANVTVLIPTALRQFAGNQETLRYEGGTVGEVLTGLTTEHGELRKHLYRENGQLRNFVNIYLNDEDIRYLDKDGTPVDDGDTITIVPAIAGGVAATEEITFSPEEIGRYSRHLIMPEVTLEGQKKLKAARVLLIGAGGLGAPLGLYLTAAGIGHLGIVDSDVVDDSNLQRQVTFTTDDIGTSKLDAAKRRLGALNPAHRDRDLRDAADERECARPLQGLRHHRRWDRQLPDALPRQRRLRPPRQAERLRLDLPLRGAGLDLRRTGWPLLPLPLPGAAPAGAGPVVRGGGRARRAAGDRRGAPGGGGDQAGARHRRAADRAACSASTR